MEAPACPIQLPADGYVDHGDAFTEHYAISAVSRLVRQRALALRGAGYRTRLLWHRRRGLFLTVWRNALPPPPWPPLSPSAHVRVLRRRHVQDRPPWPTEVLGTLGPPPRRANLIDPRTITRFDRTQVELQEFLLFAVVVAGKRADQQAVRLATFLSPAGQLSPFEYIQKLDDAGTLIDAIKASKLGQHTRIGGAFARLAKAGLDLTTCSIEDLEAVPGIGPKTARFFLLHSRHGVRCAALDTHILAWMREHGVKNVPDSTPQTRSTYARLEKEFLRFVDQAQGDVATIDLEIWKSRQKRSTPAKPPAPVPAAKPKPRRRPKS